MVLRFEYFRVGLQYYIAARYAAFSAFVPVCGNLFHHAVEMYLKGYLSQSLNEAQRRDLGHDLQKSWNLFKTDVADPSLSKFDALISEPNKHGDIRYPEKSIRDGMTAYILRPGSGGTTTVGISPQAGAQYEIRVDELDALSKIIIEKSGVNAKALTVGLNTVALDYLNRDSRSPLT